MGQVSLCCSSGRSFPDYAPSCGAIRNSDTHVTIIFCQWDYPTLYKSTLSVTPYEFIGRLSIHRQLPFMHKGVTSSTQSHH